MKQYFSILVSGLLFFVNPVYALPFNVTPVGNLPTGVIPGLSVSAAYTVVNNTSKNLNNIYVNLPPNVTVASGGCGSTFNLASGASCTLNLTITGVVNAKDPSPRHHLFVCLPGGTTCAGTNYPLNIQLLPTPAFAYMGSSTNTNNNGGMNVCSVDIDSGNFSKCYTTGTDTNGVDVFQAPQWLALSSSQQQAYVSDSGHTPGIVWLCNVNTGTGALTGCQNSQANNFASPAGIVINAKGTQAYIADSQNNTVVVCNVNALTGILSGCTDSGVGNYFQTPASITLNPANTFAYIANTKSGSGSVSWCSVNPSSGYLSNCTSLGAPFVQPVGIVLIPNGTQAYVTDAQANAVYLCSVSVSTGTLSACSSTAVTMPSQFQTPLGIALSTTYMNPAQIFVANQLGDFVSLCNYCLINCSDASQTPGQLTCMNSTNPSGINSMVGITLSLG